MKFEVVSVESGEVVCSYVPLTRSQRALFGEQANQAAINASRRGRGGTRVEVRKVFVDRTAQVVLTVRAGREVAA